MFKKLKVYHLLLIGGLIFIIMDLIKKAAGLGSWIETAVKFMMPVEAFSAKPYKDYKQWSIGYGTFAGDLYDKAGKLLQPTIKSMTEPEARAALMKLTESYFNTYVKPYLKVTINNNQKAALASFAYNYPAGAKKVAGMLTDGKPKADIFAYWRSIVNAGGVYNAGLAARREKEIKLFNS